MRRAALLLILLAHPPSAWADNESLTADYSRMMTWMSQQTVQPLAFNAGTTFDPPKEIKPFDTDLELTFGMGILPLNTSQFPTLANQTLNNLHPGNYFPQAVPFPDMTAQFRWGLPGRFDLSVRASDVTAPMINMTPQTKAGGQGNNVGVQLRKFFFGSGEDPALSLSAHANYLWGRFNFQNSFNNVQLGSLTANANNTGYLEWGLASVGVNAVVSRDYGPWTPFVGMGFDVARGSLQADLKTEFDTFLAAPAEGTESSKPSQSNLRLLFGTQLTRVHGADLFLAGEMQANGAEAGKTFNVHLGMVIPLRFGAARQRYAQRAVVVDDTTPAKTVNSQEMIFIR